MLKRDLRRWNQVFSDELVRIAYRFCIAADHGVLHGTRPQRLDQVGCEGRITPLLDRAILNAFPDESLGDPSGFLVSFCEHLPHGFAK